MSEKQERTPLGKVDVDRASPYDLAVVIVDYVNSRNGFDPVGNVATILQMWHVAAVKQAAPKLQNQLDKATALLRRTANEITDQLHQMERWQYTGTGEREGDAPQR